MHHGTTLCPERISLCQCWPRLVQTNAQRHSSDHKRGHILFRPFAPFNRTSTVNIDALHALFLAHRRANLQ